MVTKSLKRMGFFVLFVSLALVAHIANADYKAGMEAVKGKDYKKAFAEFKPPASKGDAESQYALALLYQLGRGQKPDLLRARYWYEKAAKQNHAGAQNNLGTIYR